MNRNDRALNAHLHKVPKKRLTEADRRTLWQKIEQRLDETIEQGGESPPYPGSETRQNDDACFQSESRLLPQTPWVRSPNRRRKWQRLKTLGAASATAIVFLGLAALWQDGWFVESSPSAVISGQPGGKDGLVGQNSLTANDSTKSGTHVATMPNLILDKTVKAMFQNVTDFHMLSADFGWIVDNSPSKGQSQLIVTQDGGRNWSSVTPTFLKKHPQDIVGDLHGAFVSSKVGFLAVGIRYNNTQTGAIDYKSVIFATHDGGSHWTQAQLPTVRTTDVPMTMDFVNGSTGFVVTASDNNGGEGPLDKRLYRSTDGGQHWTLMADIGKRTSYNSIPKAGQIDPTKSLKWVRFVNRNLGFTETYNGKLQLMRTTDGGKTWNTTKVDWITATEDQGDLPIVNTTILPVVILPNDHLVLEGIQTFGNSPSSSVSGTSRLTFFESSDKGRQFQMVMDGRQLNTTDVILQAGYFSNTAWWFWCSGNLVVTRLLYRTSTSQGRSFSYGQPSMPNPNPQSTEQFVNPTTYLPHSRVSFISAKNGYLVSSRGMWTTSDGGSTWHAAPIPTLHS